MDAAQWQAQSLCPDWAVRDVVQHLGDDGTVMAGWVPESADELPPLGRVGPSPSEMAALDDAAFAARSGEIFAERRAELARLTEDDLERPSWTPVGRAATGGSWRSGSSILGARA